MFTVQRFTTPISCYSIGIIKKQSLCCVSAGWRNERGKNQYDRVRSNDYCNLARMEPITQRCYPQQSSSNSKWTGEIGGKPLLGLHCVLRKTSFDARMFLAEAENYVSNLYLLACCFCCNPSKLYTTSFSSPPIQCIIAEVYQCWLLIIWGEESVVWSAGYWGII